MPELPNLLRQRLAATKNGETQAHPDADTLTAYMEQCLLPAESKTVVAHLAVCQSCREVVVLSQALMAQPEAQTVLAPAPVARWRRLFTPVFGAAAAVAAMAVIAVMVLQLPQKNSQQPSGNVATNSPASSPAQKTEQAKATSVEEQATLAESKAAAPSGAVEARSASEAGVNRDEAAKRIDKKREEPARANTAAAVALAAPVAPPPPLPAVKAPVLTAALPKKDYVNTDFFNSSNADKITVNGQGNNLPAAPQPQPGTANTFTTANNKPTIFADLPVNAAGKSTVRMLTPPPAPEHPGCTVCKFVQSTAHTLGFRSSVRTPALRAGALSSSALGGPGMFSGAIEKNQPTEISAAPARVDADSFAASSSLSAGAMAPSLHRSADSAATWKVVDGKLMRSSGQSQWEDAYPVASSAMEFSLVNAHGNDVWAGGSHASLIHSRDGGQTWETVKLGDNASGTVVSIIAGTMSVQVKTSDNQTWSSTDGGKSWTLRE